MAEENKEELKFDKAAFVGYNSEPITKNYVIEKKLGDGTYGCVYLATHKTTHAKRAIKQLPRNKIKNPERLETEIKILSEADHPNIIKLYEEYEDPRNVYLVMETCTGGELFDTIVNRGCLTEKIGAEVFTQMASAIRYLHAQGIVHRDLKPENLLLSAPDDLTSIKLIDFGLSKVCQDPASKMHTRAGTPYYIAPEVLAGTYGMECDIWSLGVILYILVAGYPPFYGNTDTEILRKVRNNDYDFSGSEWSQVSEDCKDLIRHMLVTDVNDRYTITQVFEHGWMTKASEHHSETPLNIAELKTFAQSNALRKSVLMIIANQCTEGDLKKLRDQFNAIDVNNDGSITLPEFKEALSSSGMATPEITSIFEAMDINKDGSVSYSEFLASTMEKNMYLNEERLWNAFQVFDKDSSGKISIDELKKILNSQNLDSESQVFANMLSQFDTSGDQEIDFEEFRQMMESLGIISS